MDEFLKSDLFRYGAAAVAVLIVGRVIWRLLFPQKVLVQSTRVRCSSCGWTGTIGKYNRKCSKCGSSTLETVKGK